jgi:hypothetical protein
MATLAMRQLTNVNRHACSTVKVDGRQFKDKTAVFKANITNLNIAFSGAGSGATALHFTVRPSGYKPDCDVYPANRVPHTWLNGNYGPYVYRFATNNGGVPPSALAVGSDWNLLDVEIELDETFALANPTVTCDVTLTYTEPNLSSVTGAFDLTPTMGVVAGSPVLSATINNRTTYQGKHLSFDGTSMGSGSGYLTLDLASLAFRVEDRPFDADLAFPKEAARYDGEALWAVLTSPGCPGYAGRVIADGLCGKGNGAVDLIAKRHVFAVNSGVLDAHAEKLQASNWWRVATAHLYKDPYWPCDDVVKMDLAHNTLTFTSF